MNRDPRRSRRPFDRLSKITLDPIALATLAEAGYHLDTVPAPGVKVVIRRNANSSTGGTATDVTDIVHPLVAETAVDAARVVGLDVAGIDVIARDITRPLEEQGGIIVEVNAGPGYACTSNRRSAHPGRSARRSSIHSFPKGENGRIPIVAVTGVNGKTTVTRLVARMLQRSGKVVGMTCTDGIHVKGVGSPRAIAQDRKTPLDPS